MRFLALCVATTVVAIATLTVVSVRPRPVKLSSNHRFRKLPSSSKRLRGPWAFPIAFSVN
jgi:hypothetical protein